ncbi:MAG TPA: SEC-C metal-binding domain-containing protein, partial [Ilumatobacteraceae bacterium]|nr:SEC-C metal-binding domain-containing protein [Ilumatobacteraceae bacterium]
VAGEVAAEAAAAESAPAAAVKQAPRVKDEWAKTSRNAPCPCGSGKKFKACHGANV